MTRILWIGLGSLALALGLLGIVLPLLPTTPFLLLAAYAFARSSERLHDWLVTHPRLGRPIADWRREGAVSRRAKALALAAMALAFGAGLLADPGPTVLAIHAVVLLLAAAFVLTRPAPGRDREGRQVPQRQGARDG